MICVRKKIIITSKLTTLKAIAQLDEPSIVTAEKLIAGFPGGAAAKPRPSRKGQISSAGCES